MDTNEFLNKYGSILFRGYWRGGKDGNPRIRNGKSEPVSLDKALEKYHYLLGALQPYVVIVDYDTPEAFECRLQIARKRQEHCIVIRSQGRGGHFYWFDTLHAVQLSNNKNKTLLTLYPVDYKCGYKIIKSTGENKEADNYGCLSKEDRSLREIVYCNIREDNTLDEIPFYDLRLKSDEKFDFLGMVEGDSRQENLYSYMIPVKKAGYSYEQFREVAELIEHYLLSVPLGQEFENAIRREAWDSISIADEIFFDSRKFKHDKFAEHIRSQYHVKKINGQLHAYEDGIYKPGYEAIERAMLQEISSLTSNQRKEVLKYLDVMCVEEEQAAALNLFAFKNGIYDISTDSMQPFNPQYIITNKIPWSYNPDAKSDLVDSVLDRLSCGDADIKELLKEVAGACLYRSAAIGGGKAAILVGDKSNGKSTFLHMVQTMLGKDNYSAIDLGDLKDRFSTIMLYGKLANIGDDISNEYISDTSILKKMITGEVIKAEQKGVPAINFMPYAMHIYSANDIPRMKDKTGAVLRRLLLIPLNGTFTKDSPEYDPFIKYKLSQTECMEYFIQCALDGLAAVLDNKAFTVPAKVQQEKEFYSKENNPVLAFIENTDREKIINQPTDDVFTLYQIFCSDNEFKPGKKITFSKEINKALGTETMQKKITGKKHQVFVKK